MPNNQPTYFAYIGLVLLWLTPFSILKNMQIFSIAVLVAGIVRFFNVASANNRFKLSTFHLNKLNLISVVLIAASIYSFSAGLISLLSIDVGGLTDISIDALIWRLFSQFGAMLVYMCIIICGYHMALFFNENMLSTAIVYSFIIITSVCCYQLIAFDYGLPYFGNFAFDNVTGLRISGLASEPKYLAGYFAVILIYFFHRFIVFNESVKRSNKFLLLAGILIALYLFRSTSSANGVFVVFIGVVLLTFVLSWPNTLFISAVVIASLFFVDLRNMFTRESHVSLIDNIFNLNLELFDDLIMLPLMAWEDNVTKTILGYGPGMMHFYALPFVNYSSWIATEDVFIEGNIAAITLISNYGLILYATLLFKVGSQSIAVLKYQDTLSLRLFFVASFFVGALLQGNVSIPFYLAIGWILRWKVDQNRDAGRVDVAKAYRKW